MATSLLFGAGDLGTQIGFDLARAGDDVVALRRHADRVPEPLTGISCDLGAGVDAVRAALEPLTKRGGWERGPQRVVVCLTPDARDEEAYRATFVEATGTALAAIAALGWAPERALFVSSTAVCSSGGLVDENTPPAPQTPTARVLAEAEQLFLAALPASTRGIVVRPSGIYGPGREWFVNRVSEGDVGDPSRTTHRVHRDDLARAITHLLTMTAEPDALYLVTDDAPASAGEVATYLAERLDADADPSWRGEWSASRRLDNSRLRRTGFAFDFPTYREGYAAVLDGDGVRHS